MEVKIYKVPLSSKNPQGYRFRCFMVDPRREELVGYDNHWPKGSHRHFLGREEPYEFTDIVTLLEDFEKDCRRILKEVENDETA